MIGVLARGDLRQQARSGQTFVDDGDRHVPDGDMVMTLRAGILETHVLADEQARRPIIELLADVLAELLAHVAAARTTSVRLGKRVLRANPWQTLGQLLWTGVIPRSVMRRSPWLHSSAPSRATATAAADRSVPPSGRTTCAGADPAAVAHIHVRVGMGKASR